MPLDGETHVKYMLLIYMTDDAMNDAEREACCSESTQLAHELDAKGSYIAASPLHPTSMATSVKCATASRSSPTAPSRKRANISAATS